MPEKPCRRLLKPIIVVSGVVIACAVVMLTNINVGLSVTSAQAGVSSNLSPVKAMPNRDAYFPGTEDLAPNEMRVISLGTAMPFQRPAQAAPSFLVQRRNPRP